MKIILRNFAEPQTLTPDQFPRLSETTTGHLVGERAIDWKQDFSPLTYRYYIWSDQESRMVSLNALNVIETREGLQAMTSLYGHRYLPDGNKDLGLGCGPTAIVFFAETLEDSVIVINQFCLTDLPHIVDGTSGRFLNVVANYCEAAVPTLEKFLAKRDLLAVVTPHNSIANLEKQVDLLSDLVFFILDSGVSKPDWYSTFKQAVEKSTSITPSTESIQNMADEKSRLRDLVKNYIQKRG